MLNLQRRHFQAIAESLRDAKRIALSSCASAAAPILHGIMLAETELIKMLKTSNARFNVDRFSRAASADRKNGGSHV